MQWAVEEDSQTPVVDNEVEIEEVGFLFDYYSGK